MNLEFEVKAVLRQQRTPGERAERICTFATFKRENVIKAIHKGGKNASEIYSYLLELHNKEEVSKK